MERFELLVPESLLAEIDAKRGEQSRASWVRDACEQKLGIKPQSAEAEVRLKDQIKLLWEQVEQHEERLNKLQPQSDW